MAAAHATAEERESLQQRKAALDQQVEQPGSHYLGHKSGGIAVPEASEAIWRPLLSQTLL